MQLGKKGEVRISNFKSKPFNQNRKHTRGRELYTNGVDLIVQKALSNVY